MGGHRRVGWLKEVTTAVETVKAQRNGTFERRDIVHELVKRHPNLKNARVQRMVSRYMAKGPDGQYRVGSRRTAAPAVGHGPAAPQPPRAQSGGLRELFGSPDPMPVTAATTSPPVVERFRPRVVESSTVNPVVPVQVPEDVLRELQRVRRTPTWKRLHEEGRLREALEGN